MKNSGKSRLLIGFFISISLHAAIAGVYLYNRSANKDGIKSISKEPLKLSLNPFSKEPKKEEIFKTKQKKKPLKNYHPSTKQELKEDVYEITTFDKEVEKNLSDKTAASMSEKESYRLLVTAIIEKYAKHYPSKAKYMNMQGTTDVRLKIDMEGKLGFIEIINSSGHKILDMHTIKSVKKAEHELPKPPYEMTFSITISYELI